MIIKGFKFGMILQFALGPVSIFIFKVGGNKGFITAETGVLGVTFIDALYIILAILGIASFIEKKKFMYLFKILGAIIVAAFGLSIIFGALGLDVIPKINLFKGVQTENSFVEAVILTMSNPLTILFWAGVFSAKIAEEKLKRREIYFFGAGAVLATLIFLTLIAIVGGFTGYYLPSGVIIPMNFVVGLALIYFSFKIIKKTV